MNLLNLKAACEAVGLNGVLNLRQLTDDTLRDTTRDAAIFALGKQGDAGELVLAVARAADRVALDPEATPADTADTIFAITKLVLAEQHPELNPLAVAPLVARTLGVVPLVMAELAWRREG